jgi:hypothetical protein
MRTVKSEAKRRGLEVQKLDTVQDASIYAVATKTHFGAVIVPNWMLRQSKGIKAMVASRFDAVKWREFETAQ